MHAAKKKINKDILFSSKDLSESKMEKDFNVGDGFLAGKDWCLGFSFNFNCEV